MRWAETHEASEASLSPSMVRAKDCGKKTHNDVKQNQTTAPMDEEARELAEKKTVRCAYGNCMVSAEDAGDTQFIRAFCSGCGDVVMHTECVEHMRKQCFHFLTRASGRKGHVKPEGVFAQGRVDQCLLKLPQIMLCSQCPATGNGRLRPVVDTDGGVIDMNDSRGYSICRGAPVVVTPVAASKTPAPSVAKVASKSANNASAPKKRQPMAVNFSRDAREDKQLELLYAPPDYSLHSVVSPTSVESKLDFY